MTNRYTGLYLLYIYVHNCWNFIEILLVSKIITLHCIFAKNFIYCVIFLNRKPFSGKLVII